MEKFSVLMSVYYKEKPEYFDLSLKSNITDQILKPNEFVLICDGDLPVETEKVVSKYQELYPDIFKVYRKENGGLGKALHFGLLKCSNSLIARSDSDDICTPDRFIKQVSFMSENKQIGIISSYIDEFYEDYTRPKNTKTLPLTHDKLFKMAKFRNPLNHMAVIMRKEDIIRIGSYRHIPYVEDYELWVRAMINGIKIANYGEVLVHARTGPGMIQRRGTKKYIKSWHLLNIEMIKAGMIGYITYIRNMISISVFVFIPSKLKELLYNRILR
ncbi:UDP-Gal:alpha-D-GlcNAc-diphosphoundecaprenol beta-1,3-galactosyltransferase [bioreactor metagenome]|uniref:UDP-Gal:alpha-D-GlcNAc-diphosphoundecaprenol beta-1,3-galactosyltransferase n=1 Tax=bioreactor metagenome TaxID=1076179 RepID=A0A645ABV5_9ZZZZ